MFVETDLPTDIEPDDTPPVETVIGSAYDPLYPGSTPDAPYGYKSDGSPYKRRPKGSSNGVSAPRTVGRMPASETQAAAAAAVLARVNALIGMSLATFGFVETCSQLAEANPTFELMAKDALLTDPVLCRKILSAGTQSGKTQLYMAYGMLGASIAPACVSELRTKRAERKEQEDNAEDY
jgi:hypothetical protein